MKPEERARAQRLAKASLASWIYLFLFMGLAPSFLLGLIGGKLADEAGAWAGRAIGLVPFTILALSYGRHERAWRRRYAADVAGGEVEVLEVETDRAVALEVDHSSVDPAIVIELGEGKCLLLDGQWAWNPEIFGAKVRPEEDDPPWWNGLPPPHAFPTRRFTLTRLPVSGEVLGIEPQGDYLAPEKTVGVDLAKREPRPSETLAGSIDAIDALLDRFPKPGT
jgi:hypothetical protein